MNELKQPMITRSIRMSVDLDKAIQEIAQYEDRSMSKIIQRFLNHAVEIYHEENPEMFNDVAEIDFLRSASRHRKEKLMRKWKCIDGINIDDES